MDEQSLPWLIVCFAGVFSFLGGLQNWDFFMNSYRAKLFVSLLAPGEETTHSLASKRHAWVQVAKGEIELNGQKLGQGDGAAVSDEKNLTIKGAKDAEVLLFDLA